jgi:molecular chaperone DnaJ
MPSHDWFEKDFYSVLGVPTTATPAEIKKAHRKLARQHHPDTNQGDPKAEERFKEVGEAYNVLSDPQEREQYDAIRTMSSGGARFTGGGQHNGANGFEDILSTIFGAGGQPGEPHPGGGGRFANSGGFEDLLSMFNGPSATRSPRAGQDLVLPPGGRGCPTESADRRPEDRRPDRVGSSASWRQGRPAAPTARQGPTGRGRRSGR